MGEFSYCCRSAQNTTRNGYNAQGVNLNFYEPLSALPHHLVWIESTRSGRAALFGSSHIACPYAIFVFHCCTSHYAHCPRTFSFGRSFISYNSHHTNWAQSSRSAPAPKAPARGQKTRGGIEGEDSAAAGIESFLSLKGPRFFFPSHHQHQHNTRAFLVYS